MLRIRNTKKETHMYLLFTLIGSIISTISAISLIALGLYSLSLEKHKDKDPDPVE